MVAQTTTLSALAFTALLLSLSQAQAQQACRNNFKTDGVPMVTGLTYRSWDLVTNRAPAAVLKNLAAAVAAEGFAGIRVDKATSSVVAIQETTGSGRPQTLRVTAAFVVQQGQVAPEGYVRDALCRVIAGGRG
ncbi:hypothetical protein SAMN05216304_102310 [Bosea sp. OK403]|uniref:hypothetical protein n=1 Tax=Bosea sp. OK403 TaxID=1855286 RepID=UPI0008EF07C1|nr:hypothetical protein [Bosea sp. OK403]SFI33618.1 hypothetical protein SAMN05216304_102310 [Bosea sp. OK403]